MSLNHQSPSPFVARRTKWALRERNREQLATAAEMRQRLRIMSEAHRRQLARLALRSEHVPTLPGVH